MAKKPPITTDEYLKNFLGEDYEKVNTLKQMQTESDPTIKMETGIKTEYKGVDTDLYLGKPGYEDKLGMMPEVFRSADFLNEIMAQNQSTFTRISRTPVRIIGKALSEVGKLPGYLGGIAGWAATGFDEAQFGDYVNNRWVQAFDSMDQAIKDQFPIYTTKAFREAGVWESLTDGHFWELASTEGADAIGFLTSMLAPGAAIKGIALGAKTGGAIARLGGQGSRLAKVGTTFAKHADDWGAIATNTIAESAAEGVEVFKKVEQQLLDQGVSPEEAKKKAGEAAAGTVFANAIILLGPNAMTHNWLFKDLRAGRSVTSQAADIAGRKLRGEPIDEATKQGFIKSIPAFGKGLAKGVISEGFFEEGMQLSASRFFEKKALGEEVDDNYFTGILNEYSTTLSNLDSEFTKSVFLGGVLGGGMSSIGAVRQVKAERAAIYGTEGKTYEDKGFKGFMNRAIGRTSQAPQEGLANLIHSNFVDRYKSVKDLYQTKVVNGVETLVLDKDGNPQVDISKLRQFTDEQFQTTMMEAVHALAQLENRKGLERVLGDQLDFKRILPFLQNEGGVEAFKTQMLETVAQEDVNISGSKLTLEEAKQNWLSKIDRYSKIYNEVAEYHPYSRVSRIDAKGKPEKLKEFQRIVFGTKLSAELRRSALVEAIAETEQKIATSEIDNKVTMSSSAIQEKVAPLKKELQIMQDSLATLDKNIAAADNTKELETQYSNFLASVKEQEDIADSKQAETDIKAQTIYTSPDKTLSYSVSKNADNSYTLISYDAEGNPIAHETMRNKSKSEIYAWLKENQFTKTTEKDSKIAPESTDENLADQSATDKSEDIDYLGFEDWDIPASEVVEPIDSASGKIKTADAFLKGTINRAQVDGIVKGNDPLSRYFRALQNLNLHNGQFKLRVVTPEGKFAELFTDSEREFHSKAVKEGRINASLLTILTNSKGEFVDENGKVIPEAEWKDKIVYASIPATITESYKGNLQYRFRGANTDTPTPDEVKAVQEGLQSFRTNLIKALDKGEQVFLNVTGKSMGVPVYQKDSEGRLVTDENGDLILTSLTDATGSSSVDDFTFRVGDANKQIVFNGKSYNARAGFVYAVHKPSGNIYAIKGNRLTEAQQEIVVNLMKYYVERLTLNTNGEVTPDVRTRAASIPGLTKNVFQLLSEFTMWSGNNKKPDGSPLNINPKSKFHFGPSSNSIGEIVLGEKSYPIGSLQEDGSITLNPELESALRTFLQKQFINFKSVNVRENKPFTELTKFTPEGTFETNQWNTYGEFLFNNMGTRVMPKALAEFTGNTQFSNRRIEFNPSIYGKPLELPIAKVPEVSPDEDTDDTGYIQSLDEVEANIKSFASEFLASQTNITPVEEQKIEEVKTSSPNKDAETDEIINPLDLREFGVGLENTANYTLEDIDEAKAYLERVLPGISVFISEGLVQVDTLRKAHGMVKDGAIHLGTKAEKGTAYHEAYHVVSLYIMTDAQRNKVYDNYRTATGSTATNTEVEELLAEDFRKYTLGVVPTYIEKANEVKSWFTRLWNWIKGLIISDETTAALEVEEVFKSINAGKMAKHTGYATTRRAPVATRLFEGKFTEAFALEVTLAVNAQFFKLFYDSGKSPADLFNGLVDNKEQVTELYDQLAKRFYAFRNFFLNEIKTLETSSSPDKNAIAIKIADLKSKADINEMIANSLMSTQKNSARMLHQDYLIRTFGVRITNDIKGEATGNTLNGTEFDEISEKENKVTKDSVGSASESSITISAKKSASKVVKLLMGTMVRVDKNNKPVLTSFGTPQSQHYATTFNTAINKLSNTKSIQEIIEVANNYKDTLPMLSAALQKLKVDLNGDLKGYVEESLESMQGIIQFAQAFNKARNNFLQFNVSAGAKVTPYDPMRATAKQKISVKWENTSPIQGGQIPSSVAETIELKANYGISDIILELNKIGISFSGFTPENAMQVLQFEGMDVDKVYEAGKYLLQQVKNKELTSFQAFYNSNNYDTLINVEIATSIDFTENSVYNIQGERVYANTLGHYMWRTLTDMKSAESLEDLFKEHQHLNSIYSKGSMILENESKRKALDMFILDGLQESPEHASPFDKLKPGDKWAMRINSALGGIYSVLRTSDNKLERALAFGEFFNESQVFTSDYGNQLVKYLASELLHNSHPETATYKVANKNLDKGVILDILQTYDNDLYNTIKKLVAYKPEVPFEKSVEALAPFEKRINSAFSRWVDASTAELISTLNTVKVIDLQSENKVTLVGLSPKFFDVNGSTTIDQSKLASVLKTYVANEMIANIEQTKLFIGNPIQYKDLFKRLSGMVGTKKICYADNHINEYINNNLTRIDGKSENKGTNQTLRTVVFKDVIVSLEEEALAAIAEALGEDINSEAVSKYREINEADAQGYITMDEYRELLFRSGDWNLKMEARYQYEKQVILQGKSVATWPANSKFYGQIAGEEIAPAHYRDVVFNPLKPQYFGPMAETDTFVNGFYKLSVLPLTPSLYISKKTGSINRPNLASLVNYLHATKTGIAVFESGKKTGVKLNSDKQVNSLYPKDDGFTVSEERQIVYNTIDGVPTLNGKVLTHEETYYKYWGIQVETGTKVKQVVVSGTQMLKQILSSLYEQGQARMLYGTSSQPIVEEYITLTAERINIGLKELEKVLGVKKTESGDFVIDDLTAFKKILRDEAIARDMHDGVIDAIEAIDGETGIDTLPNRDKIESVLLAIADSRTVSRKRHGGPKVQVAPSLMETEIEIKVDKENFTKLANNLKFYEKGQPDENGKERPTSQMEVLLPFRFKKLLGEGEPDIKVLENIIGFRIPTQGLNSIESIKVVGFLPKGAGEVIVLPSAITAKAGSDYDIDKLNLYIPSTDKNGKYLVLDEVRKDELASPNTLLAAIDNRLNEIMKHIILAPENYDALVRPIDADEYKDLAKNFRQNKTSANTLDRMFTPVEVMAVTERNLVAKALVGIFALQSTNNVMAQLTGLALSDKITTTNAYGLEEIIPTVITLTNQKGEPLYNMTKEGNVDLSHADNKTDRMGYNDGKKRITSISQILSVMINASVDAAKDDYIVDLGVNAATAGAFSYLIRAGVPVEAVATFLNQPVIKKYLELQNAYESHIAEAAVDSDLLPKMKAKQIRLAAAKTFGYTGKEDITALQPMAISVNELKQQLQIPKGAIQAQVLADFLRYQEIGKKISEETQGTTYDTNQAGTVAELILKLRTTDNIIKAGEFLNYEKLFTSKGFFAAAKNSNEEVVKMMKPTAVAFKESGMKTVIDIMSEVLLHPANKKSMDDKANVLNKAMTEMLTSMVQNYDSTIQGVKQTRFINEFEKLMKPKASGNRSVAEKVATAQAVVTDNLFLNSLVPVLTSDIHYVMLKPIGSAREDLNAITNDWRLLFNNNNTRQLATDLVKVAFLQTGFQNAPNNMVPMIPFEILREIVISSFNDMKGNFDAYDYVIKFFENNTQNENVVPTNRRNYKGEYMGVSPAYPFSKTWQLNPEFTQLSESEKANAYLMGISKFLPTPTIATNENYQGILGHKLKTYSPFTKGMSLFFKGMSLKNYGNQDILNTIQSSAEFHQELSKESDAPIVSSNNFDQNDFLSNFKAEMKEPAQDEWKSKLKLTSGELWEQYKESLLKKNPTLNPIEFAMMTPYERVALIQQALNC